MNCNHSKLCTPTIYHELIAHLPQAVVAVAFALGLLSITAFFSELFPEQVARDGMFTLFHCFHFIHILFAAAGTIVTFLRYSNKIVPALIVGIISPTVFCLLSDVILPYIGASLLGVQMDLHLCLFGELHNIIPFLAVGVISGFAIHKHAAHLQKSNHTIPHAHPFYSCSSHSSHILVSSLASAFYLVSNGFYEWQHDIGIVFLFLVIAVVVPCTLSDVVVPVSFAKISGQNERHTVC